MSDEREKVARLQKRLDHLRGRLRANPSRSYDAAEASALQFVIDRLTLTTEAIDTLREIIRAGDECGHQDCRHSMDPWTHARALLDRLESTGGHSSPRAAAPATRLPDQHREK